MVKVKIHFGRLIKLRLVKPFLIEFPRYKIDIEGYLSVVNFWDLLQSGCGAMKRWWHGSTVTTAGESLYPLLATGT